MNVGNLCKMMDSVQGVVIVEYVDEEEKVLFEGPVYEIPEYLSSRRVEPEGGLGLIPSYPNHIYVMVEPAE